MKILLIYFPLIISFSGLLISCQREISPEIEPLSAGALQKDSNGNCEPVRVSGSYVAGQILGDTNYLDIQATITSPGSYRITTDTINGYFFKESGVFSSNGSIAVKLPGTGNPIVLGVDHFTIKYNGTACTVAVPVNNTLTTAAFTLEGAPGLCMNDTVYGSYVKGIPLDTGAKVKITLNVNVPGTYNITTNSVNGYSFSANGSLPATGVQTVFLTASGTPLEAATDEFTVMTSNSACNFSVIVLSAVTVSSNDYFPLTDNSYWTYDDLLHPGDSIKKTVVDTITINASLYQIVEEDVMFGGPYQYYFHKTASTYAEYAAPNKYTTFFQYKDPVNEDIPFLKENLTTGALWETPEYIDTSANGDIIVLKYDFTCTDADATVTLNGKAFANVYKITMFPLVKQTGSSFEYTNEKYLFYYAKGIGLIYLEKTFSGFVQTKFQLRNWQVY